jgi:NADH dehydrogenase
VIIGVTGASGFVGRHIIDQLVERGHRPRALLRDAARRPFANPHAVDVVQGSLGDRAALERLTRGTDAVIHLVGIIVERGAATFDAVHVEGTRAVVSAARAAGVRRFVHMSALGARDTADATAYHRTKARGEAVVRDAGVPHVIMRPSFISGRGNVPIATLARVHRFAPVVPVFGDGSYPLQPVWIGDVALAFALAAEGQSSDGAFELGGPSAMPYAEFVRAIGRASGHPRRLVHVPLGLMRLAARAFDLLGPFAPLTSDQLQMLVEGNATPDNALEREFGIRPLAFEEGLRRYLGEPSHKNQTRGQ